jgi:hypothetical protein
MENKCHHKINCLKIIIPTSHVIGKGIRVINHYKKMCIMVSIEHLTLTFVKSRVYIVARQVWLWRIPTIINKISFFLFNYPRKRNHHMNTKTLCVEA